MINCAAPLTPVHGLPPCTPARAFLDVRPSTSVHWAHRVLAPPRRAGPAPSAGARGAAPDARRPGPFPAPPWPRLPCGLLTRPSCSLPSSTLLARGVPFRPPRPAPRPAPFRAGRLRAPLWRPRDWSAPLASLPRGASDGKNFQTASPGWGGPRYCCCCCCCCRRGSSSLRSGKGVRALGALSREGGANTAGAGAGGRAIRLGKSARRPGRECPPAGAED